MDFGLFYLMQRDEQWSEQAVYDSDVRQMLAAEGLGYTSVWIAEHHFNDYGLCPAPTVLASHVAARTSTIRVGMGVSLLPLHHPVDLAEQLDQSAAKLKLKERFIYAQAPVDTRTESQVQEYLEWSSSHALTGKAGKPWFLDAVDGHSRLDRMEQALRSCTLWLWLDLRFPGVYGHVDEVIALRSLLNDGIERQLKGKRPLAQVRRGMRRQH